MFRRDITRLRKLIRELKDVRAKAQAEGLPLEELNLRILHVQNSLKFLRLAQAEFFKGLSPGTTDDEGEDTT